MLKEFKPARQERNTTRTKYSRVLIAENYKREKHGNAKSPGKTGLFV